MRAQKIHSWSRHHILLAASFTIIFSLTCWIYALLPIHIDLLTILDVSQQIVAGKLLYRDIILPTTPYENYYHIPLIHLTQWLNLDIHIVHRIFTLSAITLLYSFNHHIITRAYTTHSSQRLNLLITLQITTFILPLALDYSLGQKEHYIAMGLLSYLLMRLFTTQGTAYPTWAHMLTGLMITIAILLKPLYILYIPIIELALFFSARARYTFPSHMALTSIALGSITLALSYTTLLRFIDVVWPLMPFYKSFDMFSTSYKTALSVLYCTPLILPIIYTWHHGRTKLPAILGLSHIAISLLVVAIQGKFWLYHMIPLICIAPIFWLLQSHQCPKKPHQRDVIIYALVMGLIFMNQLIVLAPQKAHERNNKIAMLQRHFQHHPQTQSKTLLSLSPQLDYSTLTNQFTRYQNITPYVSNWLLSGIRTYKTNHNITTLPIETTTINHLATIIEQKKPSLILDQTGKYAIMPYLLKFDNFARAMQPYQHAPIKGDKISLYVLKN